MDFGPWDVLKKAETLGWEDSGYTETLERTVKRAFEYLKRSAEGRQWLKEPVK